MQHRNWTLRIEDMFDAIEHISQYIQGFDMETCYKIFRADLLKSMNLTSQRFGIEVEFTAYVAKVRTRVFELPISYFPRTCLQGKKISWKDGVAALFRLLRFNFFRNLNQAFSKAPGSYDPRRPK